MTQETRIRNIAIYPIKSCAGIQVDRARLTRSGLVVGIYTDHEFMVVNNDPKFIDVNEEKLNGVYNFVTQRDKRHKGDTSQGLSIMALVKPEFDPEGLRLTWNHQDQILLPHDAEGTVLRVNVWGDICRAMDQGDRYADWLSEHLGMCVRLVKASGPFSRTARQDYIANRNGVKFHDAYPVLWFPIESVQELSERAGEDIPWTRFRPQVVVEGMEPQYEHQIEYGGIAGIPFLNGKPCDRCPVTLVDQETGAVTGKEPLRTLNR